MSIRWKNVENDPPTKDQKILVIDSWNISENDHKAINTDEGPDKQEVMSLRVAYFNKETNMWWCSIDQRVRFKWYIPITLPMELIENGFCLTDDVGIEKAQN